jgi:hypothetical protein
MEILLSPQLPLSFTSRWCWVIVAVGRLLAGKSKPNDIKTSLYGSGEKPQPLLPLRLPPIFPGGVFLRLPHLGMLVLGTGYLSVAAAIYVVGLSLWPPPPPRGGRLDPGF